MNAPAAAPFGTVFGPTLARCRYVDGDWSPPELTALAELRLHPACHALHYGSSCFEGLKAYRWADDSLRLFRAADHAARLRQSAALLCLPCPSQELIETLLHAAAAANREVTPAPPGSLYLRPTLIGTDANIGAAGSPSRDALLYVLSSPVGDYFAGGDRALRILVDDQHQRTATGFGRVKTGGNYAAALRHTRLAQQQHRADQVLFCPGGDVQETGASNFLLINDREIVTKPLDDTFLHGVTRASVLRLAERMRYVVSERDFDVAELLAWVADGGEAALAGTAAVLAGVGALVYRGRDYPVGDGATTGANTRRLRDALTALQRGEADDEFAWLQLARPL